MSDDAFLEALEKFIQETNAMIRRKDDEIKRLRELNELMKTYQINEIQNLNNPFKLI